MHLDRDDRGWLGDSITVAGKLKTRSTRPLPFAALRRANMSSISYITKPKRGVRAGKGEGGKAEPASEGDFCRHQ